jgi:bla regulator protein BlaR1
VALHLLIALDSEPASAVVWLAWLLTYLVQSAICAVAAKLFVQFRALSSSVRSYVWLSALMVPLATAALAASSFASVGQAGLSHDVELLSFRNALGSTGTHSSAIRPVDAGPQPSAARVAAPNARSSDHPPGPHGAALSRDSLLRGLLALLCLATLLGGARYVVSLVLFWRHQHARAEVEDRRVVARFERLRDRVGLPVVALTQSTVLDVPLVLGTSEICIPQGSSAAPDAEIDAVLAHELAHVERRDGIVFPLVGLVQSLFWWQPLNHWLGSRFREAAELACDDRAVELTGDPLGLARALARVASDASVTTPRMAPAMARAGSAHQLVARVRRLAGAQPRPSSGWHRGWLPASLLIVAATASVSVRAARSPLPPSAAEGQPARRDSTSEAVAATERIAELMRREKQLEAEIAALEVPDARRSTESEVRLLELQQRLRHVRETAAWIERGFSGESRP